MGIAAIPAPCNLAELIILKRHDPVRRPQHIPALAVFGCFDDAPPVPITAELDGAAAQPSKPVICAVVADGKVWSSQVVQSGVSLPVDRAWFWFKFFAEQIAEEDLAFIGIGFVGDPGGDGVREGDLGGICYVRQRLGFRCDGWCDKVEGFVLQRGRA